MCGREAKGPPPHVGWIYASVNPFTNSFFVCKYALKSFSSSRLFCLSSVPDSSFVFMDSFLCVKGLLFYGFTAVYRIWTVSRCNIHWQKHKSRVKWVQTSLSHNPSAVVHYLNVTVHSFPLSYQLHVYNR